MEVIWGVYQTGGLPYAPQGYGGIIIRGAGFRV